MKITNLFVIVFSGMVIISSCKPAKERAEIKIKNLEKKCFRILLAKQMLLKPMNW